MGFVKPTLLKSASGFSSSIEEDITIQLDADQDFTDYYYSRGYDHDYDMQDLEASGTFLTPVHLFFDHPNPALSPTTKS